MGDNTSHLQYREVQVRVVVSKLQRVLSDALGLVLVTHLTSSSQ